MKTKLIFIIFVLSCFFSYAQKKSVADIFFEKYAFIKAIELYEDDLKDKGETEHILTRLGDCYYNNSNSEKAAFYYKKALDKFPKIDAEYVYKYIQTQRSLGEYEQANMWYEEFKNRFSNDDRAQYTISGSEPFNKMAEPENVYVEIENLDLNTEYSDFGGYTHGNKMYLASTRNTQDASGNKIYKWNEQPFLDLYESEVSENNGVKNHGSVNSINYPDVNTDYHESTIAITNDGKTIYFTRDNLNKRNRLDSDRKGTTHLKLYKAAIDDQGTWSAIEELKFNGDDFSTGHPALSPDNKQLYFVSDRDHKKDSVQTDIYVVDILDNGESYSAPRNLGSSVNTKGREMFPFIAKDSTLYYSSDGRLNLGLLDIYRSDILKDFNAEAVNLEAPFNSGYDDFAFYIDPETEQGYFSSNREHDNAKGNDDIYSFAKYECQQLVKGVVRDKKTNEPLANATVELRDETGLSIGTVTTSESGEYSFEIECDKNYKLRGSKPDYNDDLKSFASTAENNFEHEIDLFLECPLCEIPCEIVINPIFFDFDKWNIRTDSKAELELIVDIMRNHPLMKIEIESHTDRRGSHRYNDKLSDRRANSTRDYIISRGIAEDRIVSAKGFGERQLLISNETINNMTTTAEKEAAHQENRRSHFRIVDCKDNE